VQLSYCPSGMNFWDLWFAEHRGTVHMFYQQGLAPGSHCAPNLGDYIGHAESNDLITWRELPPALGPGPEPGLEDMWPWTGCAIAREDQCYMFYTMRASREQGRLERTGLATSEDFRHWERYPGNPVIETDSRWYLSASDFPEFGRIDCRDLIVVADPEEGGWVGYFAARVPAAEQAETSVIAAARTNDLVHWEVIPPAFIPEKYGTIEVPDVFYLDGRWYMTCYTGTGHGNRGIFSDPHVLRGSIYAVSDRLEGPFREIEGDNVFDGAAPLLNSSRSLLFEGERYVFTTNPTMDNRTALSPPMVAKALPDGRLRLAYSPRGVAWRRETIVSPGEVQPIKSLPFSIGFWDHHLAGRWEIASGRYVGSSRTGWQVADLGTASEDVEVECRVALHDGVAAGLVLRRDASDIGTDGDIAVLLDAAAGQVTVGRLPVLSETYVRNHPIQAGREYHLRVCRRGLRCEVYVDDILVMQCALEPVESLSPGIGLIVDRAEASISGLAAYRLGVPV